MSHTMAAEDVGTRVDQELPRGWVWTTLGDVAQLVGGGTPSRENPDYFDGNIVWLTPTEIPKDRVTVVSSSKERITQEALRKSSARLLPPGSVLMTSRASIGYVAIAGTELATNQGFASFVCNSSVYNYYLAYWLWSNAEIFQQEATGTTFKEISKSKLRTLGIPLAPMQEQHHIVVEIERHLTRLAAGVAGLKAVRAKLKRYRAAVLKAAVEGTLTEEWRAEHPDVEPASVLLQRILKERRSAWEQAELAKFARAGKTPPKGSQAKYKDPVAPDTNTLPQLPKGWCWARAEQLCDFITKGTTPAADKLHGTLGDVPFIKVYNLTNRGVLDFNINPTFISKETHYGELSRSRVLPNDILMNIVGPPLGKVSIVPNLYPEWNVNQAIAIFRPMPSYNGKYLSLSLLSEDVLAWAKRRAKATAGQFNLTLEICRDLPLPLPPSSEQEQIVADVERRLSVVTEIEAQVEVGLKRAERLRQSILKQAFAGKLVPQDPEDEPASVLLERIRSQRRAGTDTGRLEKAVQLRLV
jgi:type I restriction enzyme, S subunit